MNSVKPVHVPKHRKILKQCGARMATLYLKNRGYSPEDCIRLLYGREPSALVLSPSVLSSPAPVTKREYNSKVPADVLAHDSAREAFEVERAGAKEYISYLEHICFERAFERFTNLWRIGR